MRILLSVLLVGVSLTLGGCFEGPKGDKGDAGVAGPAGPAGKDGTSGKDGASGVAGKDGAPGKDGSPGKDGAPGVAGKDGSPGKDGATIRTVRHACSGGSCTQSCDKGEAVVNALCIGGATPASFRGEGDSLAATCSGADIVSMQLYCLKP